MCKYDILTWVLLEILYNCNTDTFLHRKVLLIIPKIALAALAAFTHYVLRLRLL